jgi:hypothetical protein
VDAQDAVNKMSLGQHQYECSFEALKNNNGVCYPHVTGHALVVAMVAETGDVAFEEIDVTTTIVGPTRMMRGEQIPVEQPATEFTEGFIDFDPGEWGGYSEAEPQVPPGELLPEFTHFLDLSLMPAEWWDMVSVHGEDIRVTDTSNVAVPTVVVDYSRENQQGMVIFKMSMPTTPRTVRVWVGQDAAVTPPVDSPNGQYNVFDQYWRSFWYDGGGHSNLTRYDDNTANRDEAGGLRGPLRSTTAVWMGHSELRLQTLMS